MAYFNYVLYFSFMILFFVPIDSKADPAPVAKNMEDYYLDTEGCPLIKPNDGEFICRYPDGRLKTKLHYKNGKLDGKVEFYMLYHDEYFLAISGQYSEGVKTGTWKEYEEETEDHDLSMYNYQNGILKNQNNYIGRQLVSRQAWDENRNKLNEVYSDDGYLETKEWYYHIQNRRQVYSEDYNKQGELTGKSFSDEKYGNNKLRISEEYNKGKLIQRTIEYNTHQPELRDYDCTQRREFYNQGLISKIEYIVNPMNPYIGEGDKENISKIEYYENGKLMRTEGNIKYQFKIPAESVIEKLYHIPTINQNKKR